MQCEFGEECTDPACATGCLQDCPAFVGRCPVGINTQGVQAVCSSVGSCVAATATCACNIGYAGNACEDCAVNFVWGLNPADGGKVCVSLPGVLVSCSDGKQDGNEEGVDCGGPNCAACAFVSTAPGGGTPAWWVQVGIVGGCGGMVLLVALVLGVRHMLRQRNGKGPAKALGGGSGKRPPMTRSVRVVPAPRSSKDLGASPRKGALAVPKVKGSSRHLGPLSRASPRQQGEVRVVEWEELDKCFLPVGVGSRAPEGRRAEANRKS